MDFRAVEKILFSTQKYIIQTQLSIFNGSKYRTLNSNLKKFYNILPKLYKITRVLA